MFVPLIKDVNEFVELRFYGWVIANLAMLDQAKTMEYFCFCSST